MKIDEALNIVVPVDRADGTTVYVHAAPISREVFHRYWLPMSKAFAQIYSEGLHLAGPRIAALCLQTVSEQLRVWDGPMGVQRGLLPEIRRLANVVAPGGGTNGHAGGWQLIPYDEAIKHELIDQEDADEIDGVLVFFTLVWRINLRKERKDLIDGLVALWGASISSLALSEFAASLPTSTATANTGVTPQAPSLPPSSIGQPMTGSLTASPSAPMTASSPGIPQ